MASADIDYVSEEDSDQEIENDIGTPSPPANTEESDNDELVREFDKEEERIIQAQNCLRRALSEKLWNNKLYNHCSVQDRDIIQNHLDQFEEIVARHTFQRSVDYAFHRGVQYSDCEYNEDFRYCFGKYYKSTLPKPILQTGKTVPTSLRRARLTRFENEEKADQVEIIDEVSMPIELGAYYHAVIFFSFQSCLIRNDRILQLLDLEKKLKAYASEGKDEYFNATSHYFDSDNDALRYFRPGLVVKQAFCAVSSPEKLNVNFNPHIHVVYKRKSKSGRGVHGIWQRWGKGRTGNGVEFRAIEEKVKCLHCLRKYLSQGNGRLLGAEILSGTDECQPCKSSAAGETSIGDDNFQCVYSNNDEIGSLEGK